VSNDALLEEARQLLPDVIALRRRIHGKPELGLENPETQRAVLAALEGLPLEIETSERTSGIVATLRGDESGPTLLLRADTDALPLREETGLPFASESDGKMHACGHDAHTAMLVGAARALSQHRDSLAGTVKLLFQPGEEGYGGARVLIEEGLLERQPRIDAAFAIHVDPTLAPGKVALRPGPILAAADVFGIQISGKGGHASMPHHRDAHRRGYDPQRDSSDRPSRGHTARRLGGGAACGTGGDPARRRGSRSGPRREGGGTHRRGLPGDVQ
jgi:hippurate hydrolase